MAPHEYRCAEPRSIKAKFANQPAVLAQLKDHEERVAYMYQMWAADPKAFKVGLGAQTVFTKIKNLIKRVLGMWTNDERALHIMEYFHSGEYAKNMGKPNAVHTALMEQGVNKYVESVRSITEPLGKLADAVVGTGAARIRDMDIPAFTEIAFFMSAPSFLWTASVSTFLVFHELDSSVSWFMFGAVLRRFA